MAVNLKSSLSLQSVGILLEWSLEEGDSPALTDRLTDVFFFHSILSSINRQTVNLTYRLISNRDRSLCVCDGQTDRCISTPAQLINPTTVAPTHEVSTKHLISEDSFADFIMDTSPRLAPNTNKSEDSSNSETPVPQRYIHQFLLNFQRVRSSTKFLLEESDYLKLFRRDNLHDLKEFICNWKNELSKSFRSRISIDFHFHLYQCSLVEILSNDFFEQETPSDTQGTRLKKFNTRQELLDRVDTLIWFLLCSCVSHECFSSCRDFLLVLGSSQNEWSEGEDSTDRREWEILLGLYRVTSSFCKLEMSSRGFCCGCNMFSSGFCSGDCNTLQYMLMPQVLPTVLSTFEKYSRCDLKRQSILMTSLLELVLHRQYVEREQSTKNIMSILRLFIRRNVALENLKDIIQSQKKLKHSSPPKKLKTYDRAPLTNDCPNEIPSLVGYVGYYTGHVVKQPADGHCLFHSIIYSLNHTKSTVELVLELRHRLADYMQEHRSTVIAGALSIEEYITTDQDIETYILDENGNPCFATYLKIYALAVTFPVAT